MASTNNAYSAGDYLYYRNEEDERIGRTTWGKQFGVCWLCDGAYSSVPGNHVETHEIARGVHRSKAVANPAAWMRVCSECHDTLGSMSIVEQLALKKIHDPEWYDRVAVNRLRSRADEAITEAEIDAAVAVLQ
ncbi:hypothetical protein M0R72_10175 [Candidatus Pacearchaeota archaeon]|jgi:hypothetical protein|nr:hypothetical protein [Candidatus Pacearchaeota archaeon]